MHDPRSDDKPIDVGALMETVGDDSGLVRELAAIYHEDTPPLVLRIREAVRQGDSLALWHAAHKLKGTAAGFHAGPLRRAAFEMETLGRNGDLSSAAAALTLLERELDRFGEALLKWEEESSDPR